MNTDTTLALAGVQKKAPPTPLRHAAAAAFPDAPVNILIVDDEPKNLTVLESLLDDPGYRLVRAQSADEALLALVSEDFALLILDIRMPGTTGIELAQLIKERRKTARIPIIFLSAYYNDDLHVHKGYGSGAVDYLQKPVDAVILRSKVAVFAELHRTNRKSEMANRALLAEVTVRRRAEEQLREFNDTLEQRVAERTGTLRESEERYRSLFQTVPVAVFVCDRDAVIQHFNVFAAQLWGRSPKRGVERHWGSSKLFLPDGTLLPHSKSPIVEVLRSGIPVSDVEVFIERPDGSRILVLVNFTALKNASGKITGAVTAFIDITERKRVEVELNQAVAIAEKANRAKSDFLSSMSHELRTPLNAILGFAQLVESGTPPPTPLQKRNLDHILKAGWYLQELINEILDLALIESGKLTLSLEPVSLAEVLRECRAMIEQESSKRGISLTFPRFDIPCFVHADRTRLKQVLVNLLFNAVKYNKPAGTIVVECARSPTNSIRIGVRDTGEGLAPEQLAQLFQSFNRIGKEASSEPGTGIGLVMTKRLVELMGGHITVDSTVGTGSEFRIELSLATAPPAVVGAAPEARPPSKALEGTTLSTVLYVEDNPANLELVEQLLARRTDLRLLSAIDARSGIELAIAHRPAVILMDINLPGISGIEALRILRAGPATAHIPIVAVSANAMPHDIEDGLAAGFFDYITKPIKVSAFMQALDAALAFSQKAADRATDPATEKAQP